MSASAPRPPFVRRALPWLLAVAMVALVATSISRVLALRVELREQVERQLESALADRVSTWEDGFLDRLNAVHATVPADPDAAARRESTLRQRLPWFDSLYVWDPAAPARAGGSGAPVMRFPTPAIDDRRAYARNHECLRAAGLSTLRLDADAELVATAYLTLCRGQDVAVRLTAAIAAAQALLRESRYDAALDALDFVGIPVTLPLQRAIDAELPVQGVVVLRLMRADAWAGLGRLDDARELLFRTGVEIGQLDGPHAEVTLQFGYQIERPFRDNGLTLQLTRLEEGFARAERRLRAWREVRYRIVPTSAAGSGDARLTYDQYGDLFGTPAEAPFLLYTGALPGGELHAALQLDHALVLAEFLEAGRRQATPLTITDVSGKWVAGRRRMLPLAVQVPFQRSLTHLRVGLYSDLVEARMGRLADQWVVPLVVTAAFGVLGLLALVAQLRANQQLRDVLERQRAFTTRVTHELKTPIAGIKVMAENLEIGAFKSTEQREHLARRIMDEADRLTSRVDEVLNVARERTVPRPEPVDLEETVFEVLEDWVPRYEQAGVELEVDLGEAPQVLGDPAALRDALACLVDNALKYRDPDKPVSRVRIELDTETRTARGQWARLAVVDNGLGVPRNMRRTIFDRFVRVEGDHRGEAGGHGLGLSQVAEIARAHRGAVECTEAVEGGSRFTLRLPGRRER